MKFLTLHAENFMRLGDVTLPLDNQGLTLILGENKDAPKASSNGAGKSALLDALCWCLWGKTIRGRSNDEVVRRDVGKNCRVSVEWEDNSYNYKVTRLRLYESAKKPNDVIFEVNGESDDGAGMAKTQERITEALGLSFMTFQAMMPGAGIKVAELTDVGIKELLEKLLQMDVISKAQEITKEKLKVVNASLSTHEGQLALLKEKLSDCESLLEKYSVAKKTFDNDKESELSAIQSQLDIITSRRVAAHTRVVAMDSANKTLENVRERSIQVQRERTNICGIAWNCQTACEKYELESRDVLTKNQTELSLLESKINRFKGLSGVCDNCYQSISDVHHDEQNTKLQIERDALLKHIDTLISTISIEKLKLFNEHTIVYERVKKISDDAQLLADQTSSLNKVVADGLYAVKEVKDLDSQIHSLNNRITVITNKTAPFDNLMKDVSEKAYDIAAEHARIESVVLGLRKTAEGLTFWVDGFGVKGLRSLMLRHVTPILNARAKYYADILTDGEMSIEFSTERFLKNGNTKEEFTVQVKQAHGDDSYQGSSSGEKARADLAIAFALGDLAHLRANKRIPFRFLDEPFESIDSSGHESIVRLLNEQKSQYSTVFCITHKESFQQLFPKSLRVVKENGVSRLEQDNE